MVLRCSEMSQIVTATIFDDATDILLSRQIILHMHDKYRTFGRCAFSKEKQQR